MKKFVILILLSLGFFACEKTIYIDIPDNGRKLVVNSFFGADSTLQLSLTQSKYILESNVEYEKVSNAEINLYEDDNFIEKLQETEDQKYVGNYILKKNKSYKIQLKADGFDESLVESYIPELTNMQKIDVYNTKDEEGFEVLGFTIDFTDDSNTENYYFVQVYEKVIEKGTSYSTGADTVYTYFDKLSLNSTDPSSYNDDWYLDKGLLLDDKLFNGKNYSLKFFAYNPYYYGMYDEFGNPIQPEGVDILFYVYFYTVSKDYYLYYKSLSKHLEAQDEFFMEPVQVYNNVENGFGIFAGYSVDLDSARIQK